MAEDSKIEWTKHTFNPWRGCTKVSRGCKNCYAETLSGRNPGTLGEWGPSGTRVVAAESQWKLPPKWDREAKEKGERHRVFCASLADVFEDWPGDMHLSNGDVAGFEVAGGGMMKATMSDVRARLFDLIDRTPNLDWLLLTKRPENILRMMPPPSAFIDYRTKRMYPGSSHSHPNPFPHTTRIIEHGRVRENVWIGTSVEDQQAADARIPHLLKVPAKVRFLSCEPLLGPVDLTTSLMTFELGHDRMTSRVYGGGNWRADGIGRPLLHWVIVGGESGHSARPMHPLWAKSLRDQCQAAGVPFFFKQWGEFLHCHPKELVSGLPLVGIQDDGRPCGWREPGAVVLQRLGKKTAGRLLDGREWNEFPEVTG